MSATKSQLLIRMLRYHGRIKDEDLKQLLARVQPHAGNTIFDELVKSNLVEEAWIREVEDSLHRKARRYALHPDNNRVLDRSFGQLALRRGWIDVATLEDAILEQQRLRRVNLDFRIGEILIRKDFMTVEQVREILAEQGPQQCSCVNCDSVVDVSARAVEEEGHRCPICSGELRPTPFLDSVQTDACVQ